MPIPFELLTNILNYVQFEEIGLLHMRNHLNCFAINSFYFFIWLTFFDSISNYCLKSLIRLLESAAGGYILLI
jgi:hypothetical protein